ncbi:MAG TPA: phage tail length tape measure family protein, partial [Burkholderiaceae bacterium]|nr:phage tail length tape measure family protein [Burkholderiaceae bacterium]
MTDLVSKLIVTADAQGVEAGLGRAKKSLASLGATATEVGQQASAGVDKIGTGGQKAAAKVERATTSLIGSIQRTTAALEAGGRSSTEYYRALAAQRGINPEVLKPYLDSLDAVTTKQRAAAVATAAAGQPLEKYAMSAKATAAAMRGLPAQITDIVVGLQTGQAPMTVLLQQGGQLKDMFGGIGPAARALGGFILGLVNPFTIAAAAIGAVGLAYFKGSQEADAFRKALVLTGNAAGVTVGQLGAMAASIGAVAGTQHAAADALAQLAATGALAGEGLRDAAQAAVVFERATGQAIGDTVKQYAELGRAPLEASVKLNESLHYLTLTTYGQIRALEEQGRTADAAAAAQRAYTDALTSRAGEIEQHLGALERAWRGIKGAAAGAWDAMLAIGRPDTLQDQLARVEERIAKTRQRLDEERAGGGDSARARSLGYELQGNLAIEASLKGRIAAENGVAEAAKKTSDQVAARNRFDKAGEQFITKAAKAELEIANARKDGAAAGAKQAEIEKRIADIRAKYADKGGPARGPKTIDTGRAALAADIADITNALNQLQGTYTNSERVLEAVRAAGGLSDREYYESKRAFIRLEEAAQEDALQKQIARYEQEKASGKDAIEIQRKIADARAKLAAVGANAATQITISTIQETAAIKAQALAYLSARQAAQDYYDVMQRQQDRALAGLGRGLKQRGFDAGVAQIEDRYAGQRRDLENQRARLELEGKFTADARRQYDERLAIINEFQAKSIDSFSAYYGKLDA